MPNPLYRKGARFEYTVKLILRDEYKFSVFRSAGSKGVADLVAIPHKGMMSTVPIMIQCKSQERGPGMTAEEQKQLGDLEDKLPACILLVYSKERKIYCVRPADGEGPILLRDFLDTIYWKKPA